MKDEDLIGRKIVDVAERKTSGSKILVLDGKEEGIEVGDYKKVILRDLKQKLTQDKEPSKGLFENSSIWR